MIDEKEMFRYDGDKYIEVSDYDYELDDYEHHEHGTGTVYSETTYKWKGTVKTTIGEIKCEINDFSCTDNGGVGIKVILPNKPNDMTEEQWQEFECWLENFIEDKYDRREWTQGIRT